MAARKKPTGKRQTKRAPKKRSAPDWAPRFCARLAECGNISAACALAGVGRATVYERRDADPAFAALMSEALEVATDALELEARRRAHDGLPRVKFHKGKPILVPGPGDQPVPYVEHEYSDTLLIFLLKAHRPEKFRERVDVRHDGAVRVIEDEGWYGNDAHERARQAAHQPAEGPAPPAADPA